MPNKLAFDSVRAAVRLGLARSLAEKGILPSQAEELLKKAGPLTKSAEGGAILNTIANLVSRLSLGMILGGAIVGGVSGIGRYHLEKRIDGKGDPEIQANEEKARGYRRMADELRTTMAATRPPYTPPRVQEAMR